MIDFFGGVLRVAGRAEQEPERAGVGGERERLGAARASASDDRRRGPAPAPHDEHVRREKAENRPAVRAGLVVDVDPVAARDVAARPACAGSTGIATARCFP